jgi:hypothetical protein
MTMVDEKKKNLWQKAKDLADKAGDKVEDLADDDDAGTV